MISLQDITVAYGSRVILNHINLDIHTGETLAILGASGSGKSTILRLIIGLQKPTSGKIFVDGQDILALDIAVHHEDGGGIVVHLPHDAGHGGKPRQLAAVPAPVSGDDLIAAVLAGTDDSRDENAVLPDALRRFLHGLVVPHLERVIWEVVQLRQREQGNFILLHGNRGF